MNKNISLTPDGANGIKLEHFNLQDRSEFRVKGPIWFQFHYDNLLGSDIGYGSMGMAIHRWTGSEWKLHNYKSSYGGQNGTLRASGGPGGGPAHEDHWKVDRKGVFALTPYVSFDRLAIDRIVNKRDPASVRDVSLMAMPTYISIGQATLNGKLEQPPAPLFREKVEEEEVEEEIEVPGEGVDDDGVDDDGVDDDGGADEGGTDQGSIDEGGTDDGSTAPGQPITTPTNPVEPQAPGLVTPPRTVVPAQSMAAEEVSRQAIDWHAGSGVGAVRIVLSRRQGDQWLAHTTLTQALDDDNRVEVIFLEGGGE